MAVNRILVGDIEITGIYNLTSGNVNLTTSLLNDVLEMDTLDCDFNSQLDSSTILATIGEKVVYYHGDQQRQTLYVDSIKRTGSSSYHLYAISAVSKLDTMLHPGGIYTGQTAESIIKNICGEIPVIVKSNLKNVKVYGWLPYCSPPNSSARDNLNQVLFAIGACLTTDLNGVLRVETFWDGTISTIDTKKTDMAGSVTDNQKISAISVIEHQFAEGQESQELFNGTAQNGDLIIFNEPMHTLSASGFSVLESGANYAKISAGTGTLTGLKYIHNKRKIAKVINENVPENEKGKENATLVSLVNSVAVAERLASFYACNKTLQASFLTEKEKPGQVVKVMDPYDHEIVSACIESMDVNMSSTLKANAEMRIGFIPSQVDDFKTFDERIVLTGSGTYQIPTETTLIRYVLISGGQGGHCGQKGGDVGTSPSVSWTNPPPFENQLRGCGLANGGAGGEGGAPGAGARILEGALDISGIDSIVYSCGVGGLGASYNPNDPEGALGSDTTLGSATTAGAQASEAGYTDPITGEKYGGTGDQGIPGGKGAGKAATVTTINSDTVQLFDPAENVTDEDGNTWNGGLTETDPDDPERVAMKTRENDGAYIWYSRGLGAGAAAGKNGNGPGPDASVSVRSSSIKATAASGVNGATPTLTPKKPAQYGKGGRGGYGGGGASSGGLAVGSTDSSDYTVSITAGTGGIGGNGGTGGPGGDGCIILYISRRVPVERGPLVTSDTKWFLDKHGRRFIT